MIKKIEGKEAYGFTMPLILDSNGNKFGKSDMKAVIKNLKELRVLDLFYK